MEPKIFSANSGCRPGIINTDSRTSIAETGPDRKKIREGLAAINSEANGYKGITGLTYFDEKGDTTKPAFIKKVKDGKFVAAE